MSDKTYYISVETLVAISASSEGEAIIRARRAFQDLLDEDNLELVGVDITESGQKYPLAVDGYPERDYDDISSWEMSEEDFSEDHVIGTVEDTLYGS